MRAQSGSSQMLTFTAHLASILTGKCYPHTPLPNSTTTRPGRAVLCKLTSSTSRLLGTLGCHRKLVKRQGFVSEFVYDGGEQSTYFSKESKAEGTPLFPPLLLTLERRHVMVISVRKILSSLFSPGELRTRTSKLLTLKNFSCCLRY